MNQLEVIRDCEVPGVGAWKQGERITDPELIKKFTGHPYFITVTGDQEAK